MLKKSTLSYGAFYNPLLPNGLPILGKWLKVGANDLDHIDGCFLPEPGLGILLDVKVKEGIPGYTAEDWTNWPALILEEDIYTIGALILADRESPSWPEFRLRKQKQDSSQDEIEYLKFFNPPGFGKTEFGRTMYTCQQIAEAIVYYPEAFEIARKDEFIKPELYEDTIAVLEHLKYLKKYHQPNPETHQLSFQADYFGREIFKNYQVEGEFFDFYVQVKSFYMKFNLYRGDRSSTFSREAGTYRITEYNEVFGQLRNALPLLIPSFERFNQLMALLYSYVEIGKNNIILDADILVNIKRNRRSLENLVLGAEALCTRLPLRGQD